MLRRRLLSKCADVFKELVWFILGLELRLIHSHNPTHPPTPPQKKKKTEKEKEKQQQRVEVKVSWG